MAECNMAVRQYSQALTLLESIPQRHRTPKVNMRLGRLYQQAGMERPAITAYKEVLKVTAQFCCWLIEVLGFMCFSADVV